MVMTRYDFEDILLNIDLGPDLNVQLRYDDKRPYIQLFCANGTCAVTGEPASWSSRKWMLSLYMCRSEVVRTVHKAYEAAILHEANEVFKYKGISIYDPHYDVEAMVNYKMIDARKGGMQGV